MLVMASSARSQTYVKPVIVPPQTLFRLVSCYTPMRSVPHAHQGLLPTTGRPIVAQLRRSIGWQAGSNRGGGRCSCSAQAGASLSQSYATGLPVKVSAAQRSVRCRMQLTAACSSATGQALSSWLSMCRSFFFCCSGSAADWDAHRRSSALLSLSTVPEYVVATITAAHSPRRSPALLCCHRALQLCVSCHQALQHMAAQSPVGRSPGFAFLSGTLQLNSLLVGIIARATLSHVSAHFGIQCGFPVC